MSNSRSPLIQGNLNFFKPKEQTSFANVSNGIATDSPYNNYPFGNVFPEDDKDVYSQGGYREGNESVNNALNNIINLRGNLQNAQNASDVATAKAKVDNEARAKADKAKKIAELQKWLADHKADYELAKKWIARFNDPMFQGLNSKGIESGDFSGASNYVLQQDQRDAEANSKGGSGSAFISPADARKKFAMAMGKIAEKGRDGQTTSDVSALTLDVQETIYDLNEADYKDLAKQLKDALDKSKGGATWNENEQNKKEFEGKVELVQNSINAVPKNKKIDATTIKNLRNDVTNLKDMKYVDASVIQNLTNQIDAIEKQTNPPPPQGRKPTTKKGSRNH